MKPSQLAKIVNIADIREAARRRLPKIAFDYIDGGVEDEHCLTRNEAAFRKYRIVPNYLVDVRRRDMSVEILGRQYSMPYGISPTGGAGLFRKDADVLLAQAAKAANIPFILSCSSTNSIGQVAEHAGGNAWFQLYATNDPRFADGFISSAKSAGVENLVVTVDVPVIHRRERNIRNGFTRPLRRTIPIIIDGLLHPGWLVEYMESGGGIPMLGNWAAFASPNATADEVSDIHASQTPSPSQTWEDLVRYRQAWPGKLIIKGLLAPSDALKAFDLGVDGVIVSNHGGRQLDAAPSSLEMLPLVRRAVGHDRLVMIDGGIRRGVDILIAKCLGADMVISGRPTLFGVAAAARPGASKALEILKIELDLNLAQVGLPDIRGAGPHMLLRESHSDLTAVEPS